MDEAISAAINDLGDALSDFQSAKFQSSVSALANLVNQCDQEPLRRLLALTLPANLFASWWDKTKTRRGGMSGSGVLEWPASREQRVAIQLELCRALASGEISYLDFVHTYCNPGFNNLDAHSLKFAEMILSPMVRDIEKLALRKPLPPSVADALRTLPPSGDSTLDEMLDNAIKKFHAGARIEATEKLWDAWERLKTLDASDDKKLSLQRRLLATSAETDFRELLAVEARALTDIGNKFHIRHFERNRTAITQAAHYDYLFYRLFALVHLLITANNIGEN